MLLSKNLRVITTGRNEKEKKLMIKVSLCVITGL